MDNPHCILLFSLFSFKDEQTNCRLKKKLLFFFFLFFFSFFIFNLVLLQLYLLLCAEWCMPETRTQPAALFCRFCCKLIWTMSMRESLCFCMCNDFPFAGMYVWAATYVYTSVKAEMPSGIYSNYAPFPRRKTSCIPGYATLERKSSSRNKDQDFKILLCSALRMKSRSNPENEPCGLCILLRTIKPVD